MIPAEDAAAEQRGALGANFLRRLNYSQPKA
jgi:hypothetical protein